MGRHWLVIKYIGCLFLLFASYFIHFYSCESFWLCNCSKFLSKKHVPYCVDFAELVWSSRSYVKTQKSPMWFF